jgi:hypothetical protein
MGKTERVSPLDSEYAWSGYQQELMDRGVSVFGSSPSALLGNLAACLMACDEARINLKLTKFGVLTDIGYVLPTDTGWVVRTREFTPFSSRDEED